MTRKNVLGSYEYYQKEYEKVVNNFVWNLGFFHEKTGWHNICYHEAVDRIEKLYQSSVKAEVFTASLRLWALLALKRRLEQYNKRGNVSG